MLDSTNSSMGKTLAPLLALALLAGCASVEDSAAAGKPCVGVACQSTDAGVDQYTADIGVPDVTSDSAPPLLDPLCGAGCLPDDPQSCASQPIPAPEGGAPDAAADSDSDSDAGGDTGDASTPESGPGEEGGVSEAGPATAFGCFVAASTGEPESACSPAGTGSSGSPCVGSADCAAGFACVGQGAAAQCRPYCCAGNSVCEKGTYCAPRRLADAPGGGDQKVPVCVQADNCDLSEPSPCPPTKECQCADGTACAVVRQDGTTSCIVPGAGRAGESCPCAAGHVCSQATKSCLKICSTDAMASECGSGKCQSVPYLPSGFGVCVLTSP